jgi:hypothetical protein
MLKYVTEQKVWGKKHNVLVTSEFFTLLYLQLPTYKEHFKSNVSTFLKHNILFTIK